MRGQLGAYKSNPLWGFDPLAPLNGDGRPHKKQDQWMASWQTPKGDMTKLRLFMGGNRSGKTTAGIVSDIIDCCDASAIPPHLLKYKRWHHPIKMFLVVQTTRAAETVALDKLRTWTPKDQLVGGQFSKAHAKDLNRVHFKNGSWIQIMTQGQEVDTFAGADLHRVHFDEEPLYDHGKQIYEECVSRLIDHDGDMLITMTPLLGMTWLYDDVYLPWEVQNPKRSVGFAKVNERPMFCAQVSIDENPVLPVAGIKSAKATWKSDAMKEARTHGRFVSFAGKIYDNFNPEIHVVPDSVALQHLQSKKRQALAVGIDPGFRHLSGAVWVALDDDGVWVCHELALQETIIKKVSKEILDANKALEVVPDYYPADPAILKRDPQTGKSDQQAFVDAGVYAVPGTNAVRPGIGKIRTLFDENKLFIAASCTTLRSELARYRWVTPKRSENDPREVPVKKDDHVLDALRYAIMQLPIPEPDELDDALPLRERLARQELRRAAQPSGDSPYGPGFFM